MSGSERGVQMMGEGVREAWESPMIKNTCINS